MRNKKICTINMRQSICGKTIDSYVSSSIEVVLIDMAIGKGDAYRHILMNKFRYGHKVIQKELFKQS
mgnify:CR=1 FL=1